MRGWRKRGCGGSHHQIFFCLLLSGRFTADQYMIQRSLWAKVGHKVWTLVGSSIKISHSFSLHHEADYGTSFHTFSRILLGSFFLIYDHRVVFTAHCCWEMLGTLNGLWLLNDRFSGRLAVVLASTWLRSINFEILMDFSLVLDRFAFHRQPTISSPPATTTNLCWLIFRATWRCHCHP